MHLIQTFEVHLQGAVGSLISAELVSHADAATEPDCVRLLSCIQGRPQFRQFMRGHVCRRCCGGRPQRRLVSQLLHHTRSPIEDIDVDMVGGEPGGKRRLWPVIGMPESRDENDQDDEIEE